LKSNRRIRHGTRSELNLTATCYCFDTVPCIQVPTNFHSRARDPAWSAIRWLNPIVSTHFVFRFFFCYNKLRNFLMANKPPFAQSAQVEHPKFGLGSVLSCTEEYIVIKFDDHGEKKFILSIVLPNLKKSDRQPPAEKRRASRKKTAPAAAV